MQKQSCNILFLQDDPLATTVSQIFCIHNQSQWRLYLAFFINRTFEWSLEIFHLTEYP